MTQRSPLSAFGPVALDATGPSTTPARPTELERSTTWQGLCDELRAAQQAKLNYLATLGGRAYRSAGAALTEPEKATLAALQQAICAVDDRMRAFTLDDVLPGG